MGYEGRQRIHVLFLLVGALVLMSLGVATPASASRRDGLAGPVPAGTAVGSIDAGQNHTCAIRSDGTVACWGWNEYGQSTPPSGTFIQVSGGGQHSCGVRTNGTIACWGSNSAGHAHAPEGTFTSISAGLDHTCAVRTEGSIACWGGYGGESWPPSGDFLAVSAGKDHTCGLRADGTIACWGYTPPGGPPAGPFIRLSA